jgi:hypothetical protein
MLARSPRFAACFDAYGAGHLIVFINLQVGDRNLRPFVLKGKSRFLANIAAAKSFSIPIDSLIRHIVRSTTAIRRRGRCRARRA